MERSKSITIIFLLVVCLITSTAIGRSASVLLQDGLYAEEIEGDIDAAIKIYQQIIDDKSANAQTTSQAMYRLGMCYLKKQDESQAKATFEKLVVQFPEQTSIIDKVKPLLKEMSYSDPAALMPPDTKIYLEFGSPGRQIETILKMLQGTPFENPLAAIGAGKKDSQKGKSPGDALAALLNPSMMAEFKKMRGMAIGIQGIQNNNPPMVFALYPGKSDALRGIFLAGLGMAGKQGEPIEGVQTLSIGDSAGAAYDDNVIIIAQPLERLSWCVKQYKGVTNEPTLVSQNDIFTKLSRKSREENAVTIWLDGAATFEAASKQMSKSGQEAQIRLLDGIADFKNIKEVIAHLSIHEKSIAVEASVGFKDGHHCLAYDLVRTPNLSRGGFEAVPSEAIALVSLAMGECESSRVETAQETIRNFTGLDVGREIFANIEQVTIFALPPGADTDENPLAKEISPVLPRLGLAVTSHNLQRTHKLFSQLLTMADLINKTQMNEQSDNDENPSTGKYIIGVFNNKPAYCYMGQEGKNTILSLSPDVLQTCLSSLKNRQSALTSGPFKETLRGLTPDTSKLVLINAGGAIRSADAHIKYEFGNTRNPAHQQLEQLAQAFDKTSIRFYTAEELNSFNLRFSIDDLPSLNRVFPILMQLSQSDIKAKVEATRPTPADGAVVSPTAELKLKWRTGVKAKTHKIYFGSEADELALLAEVTDRRYDELPALEEDTKYYWRIDEVWEDETVITGDVWNFSTGKLIGWWKLDETEGNIAADSSGNGNDGKLRGDLSFNNNSVIGRIGNALALDGHNDRINAESVSLPIEAFTIALWFNPELDLHKDSNRMDLIYWDKDSRPHLTFNKLGKGEIGLFANVAKRSCNDILTKTRSWKKGTWYHIAVTFDGFNFRIYVNGERENKVRHRGRHDPDFNIYFGAKPNGKNAFYGKIDDMRIYNYALDKDEVIELYKLGQIDSPEKAKELPESADVNAFADDW